MGAWQGLGKAIGRHMPLIVVGCVAAGVLFPHALAPLQPFVPALFAFMTFQGSLHNTVRQVASTLRQPAALLAVLGVTLLVMPLLAHLLAVAIFGDNPQIVTGILLAYCVPIGIASFMWVGMYAGDTALGLSTILVSTLLSPITIPLTLQVLMGSSVTIDAAGMMGDMLLMIALPALTGMGANDLTGGWGRDVLSPALAPLSKIFLIVIIAANSTSASDYVLHPDIVHLQVALFVLLFTMSGFAWGALAARLLGADAPRAITMSIDCGLRNISSGAVIATRHFPGEAVFPVVCGTLFQQLLASLAGRVIARGLSGGARGTEDVRRRGGGDAAGAAGEQGA